MSAALPLGVIPPMFNRYTGGGHFGTHVDKAIRAVARRATAFAPICRQRSFSRLPDDTTAVS